MSKKPRHNAIEGSNEKINSKGMFYMQKECNSPVDEARCFINSKHQAEWLDAIDNHYYRRTLSDRPWNDIFEIADNMTDENRKREFVKACIENDDFMPISYASQISAIPPFYWHDVTEIVGFIRRYYGYVHEFHINSKDIIVLYGSLSNAEQSELTVLQYDAVVLLNARLVTIVADCVTDILDNSDKSFTIDKKHQTAVFDKILPVKFTDPEFLEGIFSREG